MSKKIILSTVVILLLIFVILFATESFVTGNIDTNKYTNAKSSEVVLASFNSNSTNEIKVPITESDADLKDNLNYKSDYVILDDYESVTYEFDVSADGNYNILIDNYSLNEINLIPIYFKLNVNGETYKEKINILKYLVNIGNDYVSETSKTQPLDNFVYNKDWETCYFYDDNISEMVISVELKKGKNTIELVKSSGDIAIGDIYLQKQTELTDYNDYISKYDSNLKNTTPYFINAEDISYKNISTINPTNSSDINVTPYSLDYKYLNIIDGDSFNEHNNTIGYSINVANEGLYRLGFNYKSGTKTNSSVYANILVNGEIPFAQYKDYKFPYKKEYGLLLADEFIYLNQGDNTIEIQISQSLFNETYENLKSIYDEISAISIDMRMLTGNKVDNNRSWIVEDYFPDLYGDLESWSNQLNDIKTFIDGLNDNYQTEESMYLNLAIDQIQAILKEFNQLPNRMHLLSTGNDSVSSRISFVMSSLKNTPIFLDAMYLTDSEQNVPLFSYGAITKLQDSVKRLGNSFIDEDDDNDNVIEVWVRRSRQNVEAMQALVDSEFTAKTGIKVSLNVLVDQSKLTLANAAGTTPDVVLGADSWYISDIGQRGALEDLKNYDGVKDLVSQVTPGALLQMYVDDSLYGIPESQEFYFTLYRNDILEDIGLDVPNTWADVQKMLPILQRYGMNFYAPLSQEGAMKAYPATAPFFFQNGVSIFEEDGLSTNIVSEKGLESFELMTDLVVVNGMTLQVASFYDSFRNGNIPIGVTKFSEYIRLYHAAPEIMGKWSIALSPGTMQDNGEIDRTVTGDSAAVMMFKDSDKKDQSWEFIKWWLSTETQIDYLTNLQNTYGAEYVYIPANIDALTYLPFPKEDIDIFKEQISHVREVPRIPGGYVAEREISDAFAKVVNEGRDIRGTLNDKKTIIDRELRRKLEEFGYIKNGEIVKPYKVETIESIESWLYNE